MDWLDLGLLGPSEAQNMPGSALSRLHGTSTKRVRNLLDGWAFRLCLMLCRVFRACVRVRG